MLFGSFKFWVHGLPIERQKPLRFHQKILICLIKINQSHMVFGVTWHSASYGVWPTKFKSQLILQNPSWNINIAKLRHKISDTVRTSLEAKIYHEGNWSPITKQSKNDDFALEHGKCFTTPEICLRWELRGQNRTVCTLLKSSRRCVLRGHIQVEATSLALESH